MKREKQLNAYLLTTITIISIFAVAFIFSGKYPFGDNTISWGDMNQQSIPLLAQLHDILHGKVSLSANFNSGGGMNYWGVILFFVASPFNLITYFIEKDSMIYFVNIFVVFKILLSGLSANFMFKRFFKLPNLTVSVLSCTYAVSGFSLMYFQNIIWFDLVIIFPLFLCSLKYLKQKERVIPLTLCFVAIISINFYMSYMIAVFVILFLFVLWLFYKKEAWIKRYILGVVLSGLIASIICTPFIVPVFKQYLQSARGVGLVDSIVHGDLLTHLPTTLPIILSTAIIVAGLVPIICNKVKIIKEFVFLMTMYALMIIPVFIDQINKMWHMGSYQCFPVRYGYITIMLGLMVVAYVLQNRVKSLVKSKNSKMLWLYICVTLIVIIGSCSYFIVKQYPKELTEYSTTLWGNNDSLNIVIIMFVMFLLVYILAMFRINTKYMSIVLLAIFCVESLFNVTTYMTLPQRSMSFYEQAMSLSDKIDDDSFYNVQTFGDYFNVNTIGAMGYHNFGHYTSLTAEDYMYSMKKLGYSSYWMEVGTNGGTNVSNSILANKYVIYRNDKTPQNGELIHSNQSYSIVKSDNNSSFGIVTKTDLSKCEEINSLNRLNNQNDLYKAIYNKNEDILFELTPDNLVNAKIEHLKGKYVITKIDKSKDSYIEYYVTNSQRNSFYFDLFDRATNSLHEPVNGAFNIYVNGKYYCDNVPSKKQNGLIKINTIQDDNIIKLELLKDSVSAVSFGIYYMNNEQLQQTQSNTTYANVEYKSGKLVGEIKSTKDEYLFLPIQYSEGICIIINNEKTGVCKTVGTFVAVKLNEGINQIEVSFDVPLLKISLIIMMLGLILMFVIARLYVKNKGSYGYSTVETAIYYMFVVNAPVVIFTIYIMPILFGIFAKNS